MSNITPDIGLDIIGGFVPGPSTHVHDELHARCLVLDDGQTKLALVVCDLLGLHRSVSVEARRLIESATGIPAGNVMISATHPLGRQRAGRCRRVKKLRRAVSPNETDVSDRPQNSISAG